MIGLRNNAFGPEADLQIIGQFLEYIETRNPEVLDQMTQSNTVQFLEADAETAQYDLEQRMERIRAAFKADKQNFLRVEYEAGSENDKRPYVLYHQKPAVERKKGAPVIVSYSYGTKSGDDVLEKHVRDSVKPEGKKLTDRARGTIVIAQPDQMPKPQSVINQEAESGPFIYSTMDASERREYKNGARSTKGFGKLWQNHIKKHDEANRSEAKKFARQFITKCLDERVLSTQSDEVILPFDLVSENPIEGFYIPRGQEKTEERRVKYYAQQFVLQPETGSKKIKKKIYPPTIDAEHFFFRDAAVAQDFYNKLCLTTDEEEFVFEERHFFFYDDSGKFNSVFIDGNLVIHLSSDSDEHKEAMKKISQTMFEKERYLRSSRIICWNCGGQNKTNKNPAQEYMNDLETSLNEGEVPYEFVDSNMNISDDRTSLYFYNELYHFFATKKENRVFIVWKKDDVQTGKHDFRVNKTKFVNSAKREVKENIREQGYYPPKKNNKVDKTNATYNLKLKKLETGTQQRWRPFDNVLIPLSLRQMHNIEIDANNSIPAIMESYMDNPKPYGYNCDIGINIHLGGRTTELKIYTPGSMYEAEIGKFSGYRDGKDLNVEAIVRDAQFQTIMDSKSYPEFLVNTEQDLVEATGIIHHRYALLRDLFPQFTSLVSLVNDVVELAYSYTQKYKFEKPIAIAEYLLEILSEAGDRKKDVDLTNGYSRVALMMGLDHTKLPKSNDGKYIYLDDKINGMKQVEGLDGPLQIN